MTDKNESLVRYVVITTDGYWGKSTKLEDALKKASVTTFYSLNSKKKDAYTAHVYRLELDPVESVYNEESAKAIRASGISLDGYEDGDIIEPWVNDWGSLGSWGAKSTEKVIELKHK
jgi:hypothetical protein